MPAKTPSVFSILWGVLEPPFVVILMLVFGFLPALKYMLFHPWDIIWPSVWHKCLLNGGQPIVLAQADRIYAPHKRKLLSQAYGRVLEIGAGTGETVKYYDKSKVDVIFGVEPNTGAIPNLRKALVKYNIVEKYEILPFGVEEEAKMAEAGVTKGSIDTICCIMCLCSIPTPEKLIDEFYPLLKPGGQILIFEHVGADYPPAKFIQTVYTVGGWRWLMDGCELDRPTQKYLVQSGKRAGRKGWKEVDIHSLPEEGWWSIVPHAVGRLVKA